MGVRPPSNDVDDEPDVIEFGIAALDARLEKKNVSYPVSVDELTAEYGQMDIPFDASGHSITLRKALREVNQQEFESQQDLLNALHPIFERKREAMSNSIISQLRALVPF